MPPETRSGPSRGYRFLAGLKAQVCLEGAEYECRARDLSRTGVLLVGEIPSPSDPDIEIIIGATAGDLQGRFRGRVARVEPAGAQESDTRLAVEFLPMDPDLRKTLEALIARVVEGQSPAALEALRPGAPPQEVRKALESIPLPHRIALATRANPRERELLRQDPQPQVVESLARNPNLLLAEARAIAALPQLLASTLEILASDPRWSKDDELRILIFTHARVPIPLGERIAAELGVPALRKAAQRASLHPFLREKVQRRLLREP